MKQSFITVITKIKTGERHHLEQLLRNEIEPGYDAESELAICKPKMPFNKIRNLHFASFVILHEDHAIDTGPRQENSEKLEPCLLFEATVDGEIDDFLDTIIHVAGEGLDEVFAYCEGYPKSGHLLPHLVKRYLKTHDVGYNTFYSGHPGKTVAQILAENQLRRKIAEIVAAQRDRPGSNGQSLRAIQRQLRRFAVRGGLVKDEPGIKPDFRWAEETPQTPFAVKYGQRIAKLLGLVLMVSAAITLLRVSGYDPLALANCYTNPSELEQYCANPDVNSKISKLISIVAVGPVVLFTYIIGTFWSPGVFVNLLSVLGVWLIARLAHYRLSLWEHSLNAGISWFLWGSLRYITSGIRWMSFAVIVCAGLIMLPELSSDDLGLPPVPEKGWGYKITSAVMIIMLICTWLASRIAKSKPEARPGQSHESALRRGRKKLGIDLLQLGRMASLWGLLLIIEWNFNIFSGSLGDVLKEASGWLVGFAACTFLIVATLFLLAQIILWWQFLVCERFFDTRWNKYLSAEWFTERPIGSEQFNREGHGINTYQNHLISLSRIKGGPIRRYSLRLVLLIINQICRWWYNRGDLGGIPNIHFLKWVIIDEGRRLLFVDSYHGSWDGYLDAFIDGGAVKGLNAIWSHTYLHFESSPVNVTFPQSAFLMWKGARHERPFKEIVRRSQPETLVWYSAYPTLSTDNILANSRIRIALFESLETHELDAFAQRLI